MNIEGAVEVSELPMPSPLLKGRTAYVSDGRKAGEAIASGTGVLVYDDGTNWRSVEGGRVAS